MKSIFSDADFAFTVSSLPDFIAENAELINKQVVFGTPSVKRFIPQSVKYKGAINMLSTSGNFQNGRGCATEYNTTAAISDREIVTAILEKKLRICPDTLLGKWPEYLVQIPADKRDSLPFEAYIINELVGAANDELEELVWQGATTAHSGTDLIDGIVTILESEATCIDVTISGGTYLAATRQVAAAMPAKLAKKQRVIYVAPEFFSALAFELVDANLYHFNPGAPVESLILPGTNIEVVNTLGLAGADAIVATTKDNIFYGTDDADAQNRVKVGYNEEKGYYWMNIRFNAGVQVAFPDWCVLGTISNDPASVDASAALSSIAAVMTDAHDTTNHAIKTKAAA